MIRALFPGERARPGVRPADRWVLVAIVLVERAVHHATAPHGARRLNFNCWPFGSMASISSSPFHWTFHGPWTRISLTLNEPPRWMLPSRYDQGEILDSP